MKKGIEERIEENLNEIKKIERNIEEHGIFLLPNSNSYELLLFYFGNKKLIETIKNYSTQYTKLETCLRVIEEIAFKRLILDENYDKSLSKGFKALLLWYFDFKTNIPLKAIVKICQKEVHKGNYIELIINQEELVNHEIILLIALLLAKHLKKILNASPFKIKKENYKMILEKIWKNYRVNDINYEIKLLELIQDLLEFIDIRILNENNIDILDFIIISLIKLFSAQNQRIFKLFEEKNLEEFNWLFKIFLKYKKFLQDLLIKLKKENIILNIKNTNIEKDENIKFEKMNLNLNSLIFKLFKNQISPGKRIILIKGHNSDIYFLYSSKNQIKANDILLLETEEKLKKLKYNAFLPVQIAQNLNLTVKINSYVFKCNKCSKITYYSYCYKCKKEKTKINYCIKCNRATFEKKCPKCKIEVYEKIPKKINYMKEIKENAKKIDFKEIEKIEIKELTTSFIENPLKILLRIKNNIKVNEKGVCELVTSTIPCEYIIKDGMKIKIMPYEIILPSNLFEEINKITKFLEEELKIMYGSSLNKSFENLLILVSSSINSLNYIVKIKDFINENFAIIHPNLFNLLFNEEIRENKLKIKFLLDTLLNYSILYSNNKNFEEENPDYCLIFYNDTSLEKEKHKEEIYSLNLDSLTVKEDQIKKAEEIKKLTEYTIIKNKLLPELIEKMKKTIEIEVKCFHCDKKYRRLPIIARCYECRNKLNYKWDKKEFTAMLNLLEDKIKENELENNFKKQIKIPKKYIQKYFKEEEIYEKLDKFF